MKVGITAIVKFKNSAMLKLCEAFGSQAALARELNIEPNTVSRLCMMKNLPTWLWDEESPKRMLLDAQLFKHTGKRLDRVFPKELQGKRLNLKEKRIEKEVEIHLLDQPSRTLIDYSTPEELVNDKETVVSLALLMKDKLTSREMKVVQGYSEGKTYKELGQEIDVSRSRVEIVYKRALQKLQKALKYQPDLCATFGRSTKVLEIKTEEIK